MIKYAALALAVSAAAMILRPLGKPYSTAVVLTGCILLLTSALNILSPVLEELTLFSGLLPQGKEWLGFLLSLTGTAVVADMACGICRQSGEEELAQSCALVGRILLIGMTLPEMLDLLELLSCVFSGC